MRKVMNPPNPFESLHRDFLEPAPHVALQMFEDSPRDILSRNDSPDLPFRWSLNPYRGCFHACAYCYARPTHEYWGFGAGTDFESKIVVKREAATLLRRTFEKSSWKGELILFSGNTDCYQPLEASLELTRACLEVCAEYRNPVGIITKGLLVLRDVDLLRSCSRRRRFMCISVSRFQTMRWRARSNPMRLLVENGSRRWQHWHKPEFRPVFRFLRSFPVSTMRTSQISCPEQNKPARSKPWRRCCVCLAPWSRCSWNEWLRRFQIELPKSRVGFETCVAGRSAREPSSSAIVGQAPTGL